MPIRIKIFVPTEMESRELHGKLPGNAELYISGVGMAATAGALARQFGRLNPDGPGKRVAILAGIAGADRNTGLEKGEAVWVTRERVADLGAVRDGQFNPLYPEDYVNPTLNQIGLTPVCSRTVSAISGPYQISEIPEIENMEGAAFFAVCLGLDIEFAQIRGISNYTDEGRGEWLTGPAVRNMSRAVVDYVEMLVDKYGRL